MFYFLLQFRVVIVVDCGNWHWQQCLLTRRLEPPQSESYLGHTFLILDKKGKVDEIINKFFQG